MKPNETTEIFVDSGHNTAYVMRTFWAVRRVALVPDAIAFDLFERVPHQDNLAVTRYFFREECFLDAALHLVFEHYGVFVE